MKKLEITIPVYNEAVELATNIAKLHDFCKQNLTHYAWNITIADNASTDQTPVIGQQLINTYEHLIYKRLSKKGRGNAVKTTWKESGADICSYMDIDLSTDLAYFPSLVDSLNNGYDIAVGSRLKPGATVIERSIKREFISRMYNFLVMAAFQTRFSDAQCGFKAVTKKVVQQLIPHIVDDEWFMDSELLIVGEKAGYRIFEEPVVWKDNPGSTVRVLPTAMGDLKGLLRLFVHRPWRILTNDYRR